ncbi:MAG: arylsulfatase A-like enzyme [Planctomycetota bacterium]|jgi:arylsulfatase A-like enzyme
MAAPLMNCILKFQALLVLVICQSCGSENEGPDQTVTTAGKLAGQPNIILVTVDTLRADHMSAYGYYRETSPNLERLASKGVLFESAYSTMGTTLPAHLSIMTGLYPHQHGYVANHGAMSGGFQSGAGRRAIAEFLSKDGYRTAAFVSGPTVAKITGLNAGFDEWDQHEFVALKSMASTSRPSSETVEKAINWLENAPSEPFFLWVHFWDPHEPNIPEEPYAAHFQSDAAQELLIDERKIQPEVLAENFDEEELARLFSPAWGRNGGEIELPTIDREAIRQLLNRYDADVLATDAALGRLMDSLSDRSFFDDSLFIFTSDHGQALGQHDWLEHGRIQGENVHVPLVMYFPGDVIEQPMRVSDVVSSVDIFPTIMARLDTVSAAELLDQASGEDLFSGEYLRRFAYSQRSVRERDWEPGADEKDGLKFGLTTSRWKYYHRPEGTDELYDLSVDPGELIDVAQDHPDVIETLERHVLAILSRRPYSPEARKGPETEEMRRFRETLGQIGYVGK